MACAHMTRTVLYSECILYPVLCIPYRTDSAEPEMEMEMEMQRPDAREETRASNRGSACGHLPM